MSESRNGFHLVSFACVCACYVPDSRLILIQVSERVTNSQRAGAKRLVFLVRELASRSAPQIARVVKRLQARSRLARPLAGCNNNHTPRRHQQTRARASTINASAAIIIIDESHARAKLGRVVCICVQAPIWQAKLLGRMRLPVGRGRATAEPAADLPARSLPLRAQRSDSISAKPIDRPISRWLGSNQLSCLRLLRYAQCSATEPADRSADRSDERLGSRA